VIVLNVGRVSREEAAVLRGHLARGGGLIVFLGDSVQAENYNDLLAGENPAERMLPARLDNVVSLDAASPTTASPLQFRINPLEYRHAIVAPFRGHEESGLLTMPIWRYVRLSPLPGAEVALAFDGGDPLLVEQTILRGRSILLATAAAPDSVDTSTTPPTPWSAISSWPSFPPLVHEMLRAAVAGRDQDRNRLVGEDLSGTVAGADRSAPVNLTRPDGSTEQLPLAAVGLEAAWSDPRVLASGVYTAELASGTVEQFAVNLDTRESDLARFDPELLPSQFSRQWQSSASSPLTIPPAAGTSYFRWLLDGGPRAPDDRSRARLVSRQGARMKNYWLEVERWLSGGPSPGSATGEGASGLEATVQATWELPPWLILATLLVCGGLLLAIYFREGPSTARRWKVLLAALRLSLVGIVLLMLYGWTVQQHRTDLPDVVVMLDDSASMGLVDQYDDAALAAEIERRLAGPGAEATRLNLARSLLLADDESLLNQLAARYNLRLFTAGSSARLVDSEPDTRVRNDSRTHRRRARQPVGRGGDRGPRIAAG
jgi:hypothetical protein